MHSNDDDPKTIHRYGPWPMIAGAILAVALIWFMFTLADGFS